MSGGSFWPALADRRDTAALQSRLKRALTALEFHPVFQPIVDLESLAVVGYEALTVSPMAPVPICGSRKLLPWADQPRLRVRSPGGRGTAQLSLRQCGMGQGSST
jgi:hypothetical protein